MIGVPAVQQETVRRMMPPTGQARLETVSQTAGSGFWTTVFALVAVDLVGIGVAAGCLGLLVTLAGQAPQWVTYEISLAAAFFLPLAYATVGQYQIIDMHPAEELRRMATTTVLLGAAATAVTAAWVPAIMLPVVLTAGISSVVVPGVRGLGRILLARTQWWGVPVVVLGTGDHGKAVISTLKRWPELGLRPVALLHEDEAHVGGAHRLDGDDGDFHAVRPDQAPLLARRYHIPYAIVAMPRLSHHERTRMIAHVGKFFRRLYVVPDWGPPRSGRHARPRRALWALT